MDLWGLWWYSPAFRVELDRGAAGRDPAAIFILGLPAILVYVLLSYLLPEEEF